MTHGSLVSFQSRWENLQLTVLICRTDDTDPNFIQAAKKVKAKYDTELLIGDKVSPSFCTHCPRHEASPNP